MRALGISDPNDFLSKKISLLYSMKPSLTKKKLE